MAVIIHGPRCNRRVTCDLSPSNDRSESAIAANPLDPYNLVGSSKRFTDPATYAFSLAPYVTFDGGQSWREAGPLTLPSGAAGTTDPAVAFDDVGNAYLVALPFAPGTAMDATGSVIGIAVYQSSDGGRTWGVPNLIHASPGDDKQSAAGDRNHASPYHGSVYAAWDDVRKLAFARTVDHGATWTGFGTSPVGTPLALDSFAPEIAIADDGSLCIVWAAGYSIKFVRSTDGGNSFTAPAELASGISPIPNQLPGGTFRTFTLPTVCAGSGGNLVAAWADYRDGVSRIYYRRSADGGATWLGPVSGQPLLVGTRASGPNQHDFHPQLSSTPDGEIGCAFYEFGPKIFSKFGSKIILGAPLVDVVLAVSTDGGGSFANRVVVTDQAWDPTVDPVYAHGIPSITFIGDYFGLAASRLGFFPFWTDTRTGVQEIFTSRVAVRPADVCIRDSSGDTGAVPSPGNRWEAPDLVVRRQPDGVSSFVNQDLLRDGITDHYIYGSVTNKGPNVARQVRLAVTVGNYPSLDALPGAEFRYPQDWYPGDWSTPTIQARHLFLGLSVPVDLAIGATQIVGPVLWPAAQIPSHATWHPCLLAEVRSNNDDSAGGVNGCDVPADPDPCGYGSYFWSNNNVCQRNLTYATVPLGLSARIELPFIVGSPWSQAAYLEVIVERAHPLLEVPMTMRIDDAEPSAREGRRQQAAELEFLDRSRAVIRADDHELGELIAMPGTIWRATRPQISDDDGACFGARKEGRDWKLTHPISVVGFAVKPGDMRRVTIVFDAPKTLELKSKTLLRVYQRNDKRVIAGGVFLELAAIPTHRGLTALEPGASPDKKRRSANRRKPVKARKS